MTLSEELRLLSIRVLQNFVRETGGHWAWEQWQRLIQRVRRMGFATITEEHIRGLCERNRERWLSGDNSVEPAAAVETAGAPEEEREPAAYPGFPAAAPASWEVEAPSAGISEETTEEARERTPTAFGALTGPEQSEERLEPALRAKRKPVKKKAKKKGKKKKGKKKAKKKKGKKKKAKKKAK